MPATIGNILTVICVWDECMGDCFSILIPLQYLLRDILQFDNTLEDAMNRISNSHRTCDLILGVGDGKVGGPWL